MKVLLCGRFDAGEEALWRDALRVAAPQVEWLGLPDLDASSRAGVEAAVVANPPPGSLQGLPRLRLIQSLWAGVDRLLADDTLPPQVPIARMVDPAMTAAMVETALWAVLSLHRGFFAYAARQRAGQWRTHAQRRADEVPVLVLGQGQLGRAVATRLASQGYAVQGWQRGTDAGAGHSREATLERLRPLLAPARIVVNLLPLTAATRGLLDARFFAALPRDAALVNLARGAHVVDADLLAALDSGHLRHAVLDVFHQEPLPSAHPFWQHPRVTLLPHVAALTDPRSAAAVVAANLHALAAGTALAHLVERQRGY